MAGLLGLEPTKNTGDNIDKSMTCESIEVRGTPIGTRISDTICPELAFVVNHWESLSKDSQRAVTAIVKASVDR